MAGPAAVSVFGPLAYARGSVGGPLHGSVDSNRRRREDCFSFTNDVMFMPNRGTTSAPSNANRPPRRTAAKTMNLSVPGLARHRSPRTRRHSRIARARLVALAEVCLLLLLALPVVQGQDRLKLMPGYEQYQKMRRDATNAVKFGSLSVTWKEGGRAFEYQREGKRFRYDVATRQTMELTNPPPAGARSATNRSNRSTRSEPRDVLERPDRGRQFTSAMSPDGKWKAFYRDRNVWLSETNQTNALPVTTGGNEKARLKFGTASWVYGEELEQRTALWWSPDSRKLAFYRFDEREARDFALQLHQTQTYSSADLEPYTKAGTPNPVVDVLVYDLATRQTTAIDVRAGQPFSDAVVGHYIYGVSWTSNAAELLFHRTNRRQNVMELAAADPATGKTRIVVREEWLPSWTENNPAMQFLKDGRHFLWASERSGWNNLYLYDLQDGSGRPLTAHRFDVAEIVRVDETNRHVYYRAHSGDNQMKLQLHRVRLDGGGEVRLTEPAYHHTVSFAPDGRHFIDVAQTHDAPPFTCLRDADGRLIAELARSDLARFKKLGLHPVELLRFKAADHRTDLFGLLHFPSRFDPQRRYPLLVSVYAGPATPGARETFVMPDPLTEFGFLVASFDSRSVAGRGKRSLDAIYQKLGIVEIDDQAAAVQSLAARAYLDRRRVGIYGTSYGGTAAALCLLRYPDVFAAACANSAVTDFRNYDTIYTERYLGLPQENAPAYDAARVMSYVTNLHGRLMIFYGTADNNVHPNNAMQLIQALQMAGKSFEVQVGPDAGHAALNRDRMMEFFIAHLVLNPPPATRKPRQPR